MRQIRDFNVNLFRIPKDNDNKRITQFLMNTTNDKNLHNHYPNSSDRTTTTTTTTDNKTNPTSYRRPPLFGIIITLIIPIVFVMVVVFLNHHGASSTSSNAIGSVTDWLFIDHVSSTTTRTKRSSSYLVVDAAATTPVTASTAALSSSTIKSSVGELVDETGFYQSIQLIPEEPLVEKQSLYQMIEVRRSMHYGKVLILDGVMQLTDRDGDSYNEMMAHVPMFQHEQPKNVLIIGGGDGYVLSEVLKHSSVEHVDHVDLDGEVIKVCQKYFKWGNGWTDPRVTLHIADGAEFVRNAPSDFYDVIIQDSSDPWTYNEKGEKIVLPSSVLYSPDHVQHVFRVLSQKGIFTFQAESLQIPSDLNGVREWRQLALQSGFISAQYGTIMIGSYPTGQIGFLMCEKTKAENTNNNQDSSTKTATTSIEERYERDIMSHPTKVTSYYHPPLQTACFILPKWAQQHIYNDYVDTSPTCTGPTTDENHPFLPSENDIDIDSEASTTQSDE